MPAPEVTRHDRRATCNHCGGRVFVFAETEKGDYCRLCAGRYFDATTGRRPQSYFDATVRLDAHQSSMRREAH